MTDPQIMGRARRVGAVLNRESSPAFPAASQPFVAPGEGRLTHSDWSGAIAPVPWISAEFARFSTRERLEFLTRSAGAVATGERRVLMTKGSEPRMRHGGNTDQRGG